MYTVCKLFHFFLNFQQTRNGCYILYVLVHDWCCFKHWMQTDVHVSVFQVSVSESLLKLMLLKDN